MGKIKKWKNHKGIILDTINGFEVIECEGCGFKHVVPLPTEKETARYYSTQFHAKRPLYIDGLRKDLEWWRMTYAEQYTLFEKYLPVHRRRILDIGCGLGFFLQLGQERGWETLGFEPSHQASTYAQGLGLEIINDVFDQERAQSLDTFDVIHMYEVLEHITDPLKIIKLCSKLIGQGGLLCVTVPNDYNLLQKVLQNSLNYNPWWVSPPEHINYFDCITLPKLLRRAGFEILHETTTFPMELFLLMGENYVGNKAVGSICHNRRKQFELTLHAGGLVSLKRALYKSFSEQGIGREVIVIARWEENSESWER